MSLPVASALFVAAAGAIWIAGIKLSDMTDVLSERLHLGQAMGGVILLAIATNLPEAAITVTAAISGNLGVAVGNILGGIAIQTVVLVALDTFGTRGGEPLSYRSASLSLVLEGVLVIAVLIVAIMATQLPASLVAFRLTPGVVLIAVIWLLGLWLLSLAEKGLPWHDTAGDAPGTQTGAKGHSKAQKGGGGAGSKVSTARAAVVFTGAALITLVAGVVLEKSGESIAAGLGMGGVLFGATVLAAATSLPELSTGLASMKLKDYQLAVSDIFGGNAFLPVLFLVAVLVSGKSVLPHAQKTDIYLAALGILLTTVYVCGLIFRPKRRVAGMGVDSLAVLVLYAVGTVGLFVIARGQPGG